MDRVVAALFLLTLTIYFVLGAVDIALQKKVPDYRGIESTLGVYGFPLHVLTLLLCGFVILWVVRHQGLDSPLWNFVTPWARHSRLVRVILVVGFLVLAVGAVISGVLKGR